MHSAVYGLSQQIGFSPLLLEVWSRDQQCQHHLGALWEMQNSRPHSRPTESEDP